MRCAWRRSSRNSSSAAGPNLAPHGSPGSVRCLKSNAAGSVLGPHTPLLAEPLRHPRVKVVLAGAAGLAPVLCAEASAGAAHAVIRGPAPRVPQHLPGARGQAHLLHRPLQTCCPGFLQSCCPDLVHESPCLRSTDYQQSLSGTVTSAEGDATGLSAHYLRRPFSPEMQNTYVWHHRSQETA